MVTNVVALSAPPNVVTSDDLSGRGYMAGMEAVARVLGIPLQQLFQLLSSGQSLGQIAAGRGVSVARAEAAFVAASRGSSDTAPKANVPTRYPEGGARAWATRLVHHARKPDPRSAGSHMAPAEGPESDLARLIAEANDAGSIVDVDV